MINKSPLRYFIDIETSPILGLAWQAFDTNLLKILQPSKIISVAWKEFNDKNVTVKCLADYPDYKPGEVNDKGLIEEVWGILDKADMVVGHNSDSFDLKRLNTRFVCNGLKAPSHYETVDTLKLAKKQFKFDSNSLNNLGQFLQVGKKKSTGGFELWLKCLEGDQKAWDKMKSYNAQDVLLLEKVYLTLRPFQTNHPDLNILRGRSSKDTFACPSCLSDKTSKRGYSFTKTGKKQRYQCMSCFSWSTGVFEKVKVHEDDGSQ